MLTRKEFQEHIENVLNDDQTPQRKLSNNRTIYWDDDFQAIIIKNPDSPELGTMLYPKNGKEAFNLFK